LEVEKNFDVAAHGDSLRLKPLPRIHADFQGYFF
jgi:hypothetical protein